MSGAWFREAITSTLSEILRRENIPHSDVGAEPYGGGPLIGLVYVDTDPKNLPPDIRAKIPRTIWVAHGRVARNVAVRIRNSNNTQVPGVA